MPLTAVYLYASFAVKKWLRCVAAAREKTDQRTGGEVLALHIAITFYADPV